MYYILITIFILKIRIHTKMIIDNSKNRIQGTIKAYSITTVWFVCFFIASAAINAQEAAKGKTGIVRGVVTATAAKTPVAGAEVIILGDTVIRYTAADGSFEFNKVAAGYRTLNVSADEYLNYVSESFEVIASIPTVINVQLDDLQLSAVTVTAAAPLRSTVESPVSLRRIEREEIDLTPGANRDISKVIQSTPGVVAVSQNNRNDVLVRGGGANENKYFLDDIEIPVLNHFSVQGGSGGYASLVNTDLLRSVNFYTGAFPAALSNGLSSVMDMKMKNGNDDRFHGKVIVGASDVGATINTPLTKDGKTTFIGSYRHSYLQFLFDMLGLTFLPTYNDYQFKISSRLSDDDEIYAIGLGSFDNNRLNLGIKDPEESRRYILGYLPNNDQVSYVFGLGYRRGFKGGQFKTTLSRDYLRNDLFKYTGNDESKDKTLDIRSREGNYRFRALVDLWSLGGFRFSAGIGGGYGSYDNKAMQRVYTGNNYADHSTHGKVDLWRYDAFATLSRYFLDDRLSVLFGLRMDGMNYSGKTSNPLKQLSPRLSMAYKFTDKWSVNATVARYYQEPTYTTLGYTPADGSTFNQKDGLTYQNVNQYVAGVKFSPSAESSVSVEGFYKQYGHLPVSLNDSLPISTGDLTDYIVGNAPALSVGKGRAYGMELSYRHLNFFNTVVNLSYTLLRSEVNKMDAELRPIKNTYWASSWDVRHILNISAIHKFPHNWTLGAKWYLTGGMPYTPYDKELSSQIDAWDSRRRPYANNALYNTERTAAYHQLDVRVDKVWYFNKWRLGFYVDIQNIYNYKSRGQNYFFPQFDANNQGIPDPNRPGYYLMQDLPNDLGGTILPSIGITLEI